MNDPLHDPPSGQRTHDGLDSSDRPSVAGLERVRGELAPGADVGGVKPQRVRRKALGGWFGIVPFLHFGEPYNRVSLETRAQFSITGSEAPLIQRLKVRRWGGVSSARRACWFIGWISWEEADDK